MPSPEFISKSDGGDSTTNYDIKLDKPCNVGEFVNMMLKERPDEWGEIHVYKPLDTFSAKHPSCEYKSGSLITDPLPDDILAKPIQSIRANGGWTYMTYFITLDIKCNVKLPN